MQSHPGNEPAFELPKFCKLFSFDFPTCQRWSCTFTIALVLMVVPRVVYCNNYGALYLMIVLYNQENYGKLQKTFFTNSAMLT